MQESFLDRYRDECEIQGHFVFTNGQHSATYFDKTRASDELLHDGAQWMSEQICYTMRASQERHPIIVPLANGALKLGRMVYVKVLETLGEGTYLPTEKVDGQLRFPEHQDWEGNIFIIEDNVSTGGSIMDAARLTDHMRGQAVVGLCLLDKRVQLGGHQRFPIHSYANYPVQTYTPNQVPDALKQIPISISVGHGNARREELEARGFIFET